MRRLHRTGRWPAGALLHRARQHGRRQKDHDHRGAGAQWTAPSRAAGLSRCGCDAMRLLHGRDGAGRRRAAREEPASHGGRDLAGHERAHLPVRNVPAHRASGPGGSEEGRPRMNRRDFFTVLGGGLLVLLVEEDLEAQESGRRVGSGGGAPEQLSAWLHIGEDGSVTVYTGKVEVGQNTRTALTQAVAEELRAPASSVKLVMGDTDLTPFDAGTFGSLSTPRMSPQLRKVAATA